MHGERKRRFEDNKQVFFFLTKEQRKGDEMSTAVHTDESTNVHLQQEEQEEEKRKKKKSKQTNKQKENAGTLAKDVKKKERERFNRKAMMMN